MLKNVTLSCAFTSVQRAAAALVCCLVGSAAEAQTRFTVVDSSPSSWVARGYSDYTVTPDIGWTFTSSRNFDNGVGFNITGTALPGTSVGSWRLNFAAPFNALIVPGLYENFERFPFQDDDRPGLEFSSTGRLDNMAAGFFEVYEATYGPGGEVLTFAADFTHYGETNLNNWAMVEIRYNTSDCAADLDASGVADVFDLLAYLDLWFASDAGADLDASTVVDVFDLLAYLDLWFAGCD